ncbi:hypothetical protein MKW98_017173 [Papaver atlanticum]|uniref:Uncharacterized protein n=1 Tax=Papaver atlanticum TaxID=357466 RepID=A0AAD4XBE1_9MAGN|nr:hypothetical protein MKW98_017173 [Papaver atlanticum]
MPRSSRHKSSHHKSHQHKHSSKDVMDSEEEAEEVLSFKEKNGGKEKSLSSRESEKRKLVGNGGGGDLIGGEYNGGGGGGTGSSKRRKEKAVDGPVSDRWNGGEVSVVSKEKLVDEDGLKSKIDLKSKSSGGSSRRHEERKSESVVVVENEEVVVVKKSVVSNGSKVEVKTSRSDKDSSKKEVHYKDSAKEVHYKESTKEVHSTKEKEHRSSEREKKNQDVRRETKIDSVAVSVKKDVVIAERQKHDELRNPELEKELEKRIRRRRDDSDDKDKYHDDSRDAKESRVSSRDDRSRSSRYKDEKQQDDRYRESHHEDLRKDKQKDDRYRESHYEDLRKDKQKDDRYRESHHDDLRKDKQKDDRYRESHHDDMRKDKQKDDKYRESRLEDSRKDHTSRDDKRRDDYLKDHPGQRSDNKYPRDEKRSPLEKSKPHEREGDGSPRNDDRVTNYKESRGMKRYADDNDEYGDLKSRNAKEHHHSVAEKKTPSSSRKESPADRGRSQSRHMDYDSTVSRSRRRSPSPNAHPVKDQFRTSSKAESQYREPVSDERVRSNVTPLRERSSVHGNSERASESWSTEKHKSVTKPSKEEGNHLADFSVERSPVRDRQASPAVLIDKPQSSTSHERRYSNRQNVNRSLDMEETGRRDDRGSRELPLEKPASDRQADGDTVSVSSSYNRNSHFPSNSSSIPTTPSFRGGASNPSVYGSSEEDSRGKSNRYRRTGDFNVGRGPGNAWKGIPNWPSQLPNNFMPFQHGPPAGGFHPMMQFPAPPLFGNHPGIPYHMPDADRFNVQMHGWDGSSNVVFGDESHMYGRPDWDQNRHMLNGQGWDANSDTWKAQNNPAAAEKDDHGLSSTGNDVWAGHPSQRSRNERNRPNFRAESIEVKRSDETPPPPPKAPMEAPSVKPVLEKTPEPAKTSRRSDTHFCHVYLSKLDISVDLTHPQLYKQCASLFEIEGNSMSDYGSKHAHLKEFEESRLKMSNTTLSASLFPVLKDTLLQRAMLLYRKRDEETQTKLPLSSLPGSEPESDLCCNDDKAEIYPALSGQKPETSPTIFDETVQKNPPSDQEIAKEPTPAETVAEEISSAQMRIEGSIPAEMMIRESVPVEMMVEEPILSEVMAEQPISFEMAVEEPVLTQMMIEEPVPTKLLDEEPVPTQMMVDEPVPAQTMVEEPIPAQMMVDEPVPAHTVVEEPTPAHTMAEEPIPAQMMVEEPIPAQMMVEEPVSAQMLVEESGPSQMLVEESGPSPQMVDDSVPVADYEEFEKPDLNNDQKITEVLDPISDEGEEPVLNSDQEKALNPVPNFYQEEQEPIAYHHEVVDLVGEEDAIVTLSDSEGDGGGAAGTDAEHSKSNNGSRYDPLGYAHNEVCEEASTPESIECRSVNLSRIHSSKSTH